MFTNKETSVEVTSLSQLSINEPLNSASKSLATEISFKKNSSSGTSKNSLLSPVNSPVSTTSSSSIRTFDSSDSVCEPRLARPLEQQMNRSFISELCFLFCCPPMPSTIAAKLAFLPPEPSYSFSSIGPNTCQWHECPPPNLTTSLHSNLNNVNDSTTNKTSIMPAPAMSNNQNYIEAKLNLTSKAEWQYTHENLAKIEVCWSRSSKNNRIACMYVKAVQQPKYVILFSHGNAIDLGQMSSFYYSLGSKTGCNIFSYDYSGYGVSTGKPTERNLYADIDCAWNTLRNRYGFKPDKIILYGQSIGTVPTVDLASRFEMAAVILHSPFMSGFRIFKQTKRTWFFDVFPTIDKISKVTSPVLVIHGTEDEVINISHGLAIYERCARPVEPLWIEGAGHNDIERHPEYIKRLRQFIHNDLNTST